MVPITVPLAQALADVSSAVAALAAVVAIGITVRSAERTRRDASIAARLAERRDLAVRIGAWAATVEEAADRHVFLSFDKALGSPFEDPEWKQACGTWTGNVGA